MYGLFLFLIGVGTGLYGLRYRRKALAMQRWPSVTGTITVSTVEPYQSHSATGGMVQFFRPRVEYEYEVGGHQYRAGDLSPMEVEYTDPTHAQSVVARYPRRSTVTVYFDPAHPASATLQPRLASRAATVLIAVGAALALLGTAWAVLSATSSD